VVGISVQGGYNEVSIQPELSDLKWASGRVPTPRGEIGLRVKKAERQMYLWLFLGN
jgi:hypothetical protein